MEQNRALVMAKILYAGAAHPFHTLSAFRRLTCVLFTRYPLSAQCNQLVLSHPEWFDVKWFIIEKPTLRWWGWEPWVMSNSANAAVLYTIQINQ